MTTEAAPTVIKEVSVVTEIPPQNGIVSTGMFFGLMFLYSIPVIGWLVCLILCFAPKKQSLKNYSRAAMIWIVIGLVVSAALAGAAYWLGGMILEQFNIDINEIMNQIRSAF